MTEMSVLLPHLMNYYRYQLQSVLDFHYVHVIVIQLYAYLLLCNDGHDV